jgi:aspartyl-tRNA(Asn)/glutamyl-tRNA(Gln) amidotransferase subunit B
MEKSNLLKGNTGDWELVIGLEVHAQVSSNAKLFSGSSTAFGAEPNSNVSFIDAGMPGMLPVINMFCVEQTIRTGFGIKAQINKRSVFDRKNYFYADLPTGYQITQFKDPLVTNGTIELDMPYGKKSVRVERIHLEQDAGKSLHDQSPDSTFIDLNRAGVGLMEIVSYPDLSSAEEAGEYLRKLRMIVRYIGTCDGDMEKGSMRCDANVSVRRAGTTELGTRNEIKNLNSIRNVMIAINSEARRQIDVLESGGVIEQATRLFDANTNETRVMRDKENAHDYRYFPDPDLYPLVLEDSFIDNVKNSMTELPDDKIERYTNKFGLSAYDASVLVADKVNAEYFEKVAAQVEPKLAANWISAELFGRLNKAGIEIGESKITADKLAGLLKLIEDKTISGKIAKDVLDIMFETGGDAVAIVEEKGLKQVTDTSAIEKVIDQVIAENQASLAEYKAGKVKLFGFFVGQVMKLSQGKANPATVNDILKSKLDA